MGRLRLSVGIEGLRIELNEGTGVVYLRVHEHRQAEDCYYGSGCRRDGAEEVSFHTGLGLVLLI